VSNQFKVLAVNLVKNHDKSTKAFCDVIHHDVILRGVRIMKGDKGFFVRPPSIKQTKWNEVSKQYEDVIEETTGRVKYSDHYYPSTDESRNNFTSAVLSAYNAKIESDKALSNEKAS
jgi:DNA-binding cell septation regulator SpoVG